RVNVLLLTVEFFTGSLNVAVTDVSVGTPVAPSAGFVLLTVGVGSDGWWSAFVMWLVILRVNEACAVVVFVCLVSEGCWRAFVKLLCAAGVNEAAVVVALV